MTCALVDVGLCGDDGLVDGWMDLWICVMDGWTLSTLCGYVSFVNLCDVLVNFVWICGWMDDGLVDLCGLL